MAQEGGPDAELLRLCAKFRRGHDRCTELSLRYGNVVHIPDEVQHEMLALVCTGHDLAEGTADMRATTLAGLRAKAELLLAYTTYDLDDNPIGTNKNELVGWFLARDLAGDEAAKPPEWPGRLAAASRGGGESVVTRGRRQPHHVMRFQSGGGYREAAIRGTDPEASILGVSHALLFNLDG